MYLFSVKTTGTYRGTTFKSAIGWVSCMIRSTLSEGTSRRYAAVDRIDGTTDYPGFLFGDEIRHEIHFSAVR